MVHWKGNASASSRARVMVLVKESAWAHSKETAKAQHWETAKVQHWDTAKVSGWERMREQARECGWDVALGRPLAPDSEFDLEARRADGWATARALKKGLD
jgi:hypothetical protein